MNTDPTRFEDRLLHELKGVVAHGDVPEPIVPSVARRRIGTRRRLAYGLAASAVIATSIGLAGPTYFGGKDAEAAPFTVVRQPDGTIRFTIAEYRDPQALEARLQQYGANVRVDYVPAGMQCAAGRYVASPVPGDVLTGIFDWVQPPGDRPMTDAESAYFRQGWQEIHPERIPAGTTLVLTMSIHQDPENAENVTTGGISELATGEVGPCHPVPAGTGTGPFVDEQGTHSGVEGP
ncbi:hypothetical protein LO772_32030 [Yinghuangia sp. ASG 101]|uniref:hypothetical protein n=1 Tax=Yinghuangia sp. ASG 101 TaxID=2896848 RepID=UPI001E560639|nr:hypothetical protein [Yinghuangia sp. ASG 101]UGQ11372.1 hypothetical protein LO772_32030 [Yinghuangia sp. ASG 101]